MILIYPFKNFSDNFSFNSGIKKRFSLKICLMDQTKSKRFSGHQNHGQKTKKNENLTRYGVNVTLLFLLQSVGGRGTTQSAKKKHLLCSVCQAGIQGNSI
jgi:hypothetical protein